MHAASAIAGRAGRPTRRGQADPVSPAFSQSTLPPRGRREPTWDDGINISTLPGVKRGNRSPRGLEAARQEVGDEGWQEIGARDGRGARGGIGRGEVARGGDREGRAADDPRAASAVIVDGVLDELAWQKAWAMDLKYEVQPGENVPPPVRTEVLVTYDDEAVYFGFRAFDPEPAKIRAHLYDRDNVGADDWVAVILDTFNDERRSFDLLVNPLGVQADSIETANEQRGVGRHLGSRRPGHRVGVRGRDSPPVLVACASSAPTAGRRCGASTRCAATRAACGTTSGCSPGTATTTATSARRSSSAASRGSRPDATSRSTRR